MNIRKLLLVTVFFIAAIFLFVFFSAKKTATFLTKTIVNEAEEKNSINIDIFSEEKDVKNPLPFTTIRQPFFPDMVCNIVDYGAVSDGITKNTEAFEKAITDCSKRGGGQVLVPDGKWLTGSVHLLSDINLHLDDNASVIFSDNLSDYLPAVFSRYEGIEYFGYSPFIYAENSKNIAITGNGKFDGQGKSWWPRNNMTATYSLYNMARNNVPVKNRNFANEKSLLRPSFIQFSNCDSILLENFTVQNSPMWTIHPLYSSNVIIRNITVDTLGLNTDGIAIDSSRNVLIENSTVTSGDDAIVIKSGRDRDGLKINRPSENIVIRGCYIPSGHSGVAIGSEMSGGISNVFMYDLNFKNTNFGIRIKSSVGRGGIVENIWAKNISAKKINDTAIQFTTNYDIPYADYADVPTIRNIFIDDMTVIKSGDAINIVGLAKKPIEGVSLKNIAISSKNGVDLRSTRNINLDDLVIQNRGVDPFFRFSDSKNITISNSKCPLEILQCLKIEDADTKGIVLKNSDSFSERIIFGKDATKDTITIQ